MVFSLTNKICEIAVDTGLINHIKSSDNANYLMNAF